MSTSVSDPVTLKDRSDILDILRGFALLGVLLDNLFAFTGWGFITQTQKEAIPTWPADAVVGMLEQVFVNGKFYSIFSILFGVGFSIILIRNEQKGLNPFRIFYRRIFFLFLFGMLHLIYFWEGDILCLYALIGCTLPWFRNLKDKTLISLSIILLLSPLLLDTLSVIFQYRNGAFLENIAIEIDKKTGIPADNFGKYLFENNAGWAEWRNWQATGYLYRYAYILHSNRIPKVLGLFLIGFYIGRKMMYLHLEDYISLFKKLRFWGFAIGLPSAFACFYFEIFQKHIPNPVGLFHTLFYATSVVPLSLAYISILCLLWVKNNANTRLKLFAPMGRMALTNYLLQTILCIFIFYGVGLGLGGNIGPSMFLVIGIGIYLLQMCFSAFWLRHFNYGPFEWVWRMLTYGKPLKMIKEKTV